MVSCSEWENDIYKPGNDPQKETQAPAVTPDGQLYNMNFDQWDNSGNCYGNDAGNEQKKVWGSANATTSLLGYFTCTREDDFLAKTGKDKHAVKLQTQYIYSNLILFEVKKLAAGNFFTGQMGKIELSKANATLQWGIPFSFRPKALEGYACYKPQIIEYTDQQHKDKEGTMDSAHVFVLLTDWDKQFVVDPAANSFVDIDNDPHIIGYGKVGYNSTMDDYERFTINIEYRNERTPKYVVVVASSSALGDYFTGAHGSALYLDEFRFLY